MKAWMVGLVLAVLVSAVSALNGFSQMDDYSKNGFGVPGDVWMVSSEVGRLMGTSGGHRAVMLTDIEKSLVLPGYFTPNEDGLSNFAYQIGTLTAYALDVESRRPRNSIYALSAAGMPATPQLSLVTPFRPRFVKEINMFNRAGKYSYEGQYGLSKQWIKGCCKNN